MKPVALVTGGTRGIGLGIAQCLAREQYDLALCGLRAEPDVTAALDTLRALGARVLYHRADIGCDADRAALLEAVRTTFSRLNVLVNNAAMAPRVRADILDATPEHFDDILRVNLRGPYFLTQAVAHWMIAQRRDNPAMPACIINISSVSATLASVNRGDYCMAKAALSMATTLWAVRLAEFGINVYEVRPGITATDMTAGVKEKYDAMIANGLLLQPRWGTPEDVGKAVAMLARGDLPYSTGHVVMIDGGMTVPRL